MRRTTAMIRSVTGRTPVGWRSCTQSPNSLELLMEHGYLFNSNSFSHDLPFLWEANGRVLVELPRQPFGDGRTYQHRDNDAGNPHDTLLVWKAMFDEFHEESKLAPAYCPFQFHPYISGRPGRAKTLRSIIQHMKKADACGSRPAARSPAGPSTKCSRWSSRKRPPAWPRCPERRRA